MKNNKKLIRRILVFLMIILICSCVPFLTDNLYNVKAQAGSEVSVNAFATKDELMTMFTPNSEGVAPRVGKLAFGKKSGGSDITWYILGKDNSVAGNNIAVFATSSLATGKAFNNNTSSKPYQYEANTGYGASNGNITVQAGHYGASDLRTFLQQMCADNTYFTDAELALMQATTITTYDKQNSVNYTVSDKLYSLSGIFGETYIYAGGASDIKLSVASYWNSGALFWLRNPRDVETTYALVGHSGSGVNFRAVSNQETVRPATNINLANVLFASAVSMDTADAGIITSGTAMSIRVNGSNKAIGSAFYDDTKELIYVEKDPMATANVSIVVQGNNDSKDWYYSKAVSGSEVITEDEIINALIGDVTITDISFDNCKIWVEITEDNVSYANMASESVLVDSIELDINTPVGNKPFDTSVICNSEGVESIVLNWADCDGNSVSGNAKFAPWEYVANLVITPETGAIILPNVAIVINDSDVTVDEIENREDDNLLYVKTWGILASVANVTNVDITDITELEFFEEYYDDSNVLSADELPDSVNVTIDNNLVESMDVVWEVIGEYNDTPGATNSFKWTVTLNPEREYNIMPGISITGVKEIANKEILIFEYTVDTFEGNYDSGIHGIVIDVTNELNAEVYYSIDGIYYYSSFEYMNLSNAGTYTVYYKIELEGYETVTGSKTVKILAKPLEVTVENQTINKGENILNGKYTISGLVTGDVVDSITLKTSNDGTITVNNIKIVNSKGQDVTANYDITYVQGKLTVKGEENNVVSPNVGANIPVFIWYTLLISSGVAITCLSKRIK